MLGHRVRLSRERQILDRHGLPSIRNRRWRDPLMSHPVSTLGGPIFDYLSNPLADGRPSRNAFESAILHQTSRHTVTFARLGRTVAGQSPAKDPSMKS